MPQQNVNNSSDQPVKLILISGRSGAGKTTVMQLCEDLGYFCIDNLPMAVLSYTIDKLAEEGLYNKIMIGIDSRSFYKDRATSEQVLKEIAALKIVTEIWYLDADEKSLQLRFNETRRRHPYSHENLSLPDALDKEREYLKPFANMADRVINTSTTNIHQLRELTRKIVSTKDTAKLHVSIFSFGFKYGVPDRADYIFDVRCLPNPYWEPQLRELTGDNQKVKDFFAQNVNVQEMVDDIYTFIYKRFEQFKQLDRSYLDIGIGCTGGQHRSVYIVSQLIDKIKDAEDLLLVSHHREQSKWSV